MTMEFWEQVLVGVIFGSIAVLALFFILDKLFFQDWRENGRTYDNFTRGAVSTWPHKVKDAITKSKRSKGGYTKLSDEDEDKDKEVIPLSEKLARDLHDEYEAFEHECLVFLGANESAVVGICMYLLDRNVEYFKQPFPAEYLNNFPPENSKELAKASVMSAIQKWAPKWCSAKAVHLLCNDINSVNDLNKSGTEMAAKVAQFEDDFDFKLICDWTDNYFCEIVSFKRSSSHDFLLKKTVSFQAANEELWEGLILCGKKLLDHPKIDENELEVIPWDELGPSEDWNRLKVNLSQKLLVENAKQFGVQTVGAEKPLVTI